MNRGLLATIAAANCAVASSALAFTTQFATPQFTTTWWLAEFVTGDQAITGVDMSVDKTDWKPLTQASDGSWTASVYIPDGSIVDFRAHDSAGEVSLSGGYRFPDATLLTPPPPSSAPCPSGCASGYGCCQTSAMASIPTADKRFDCLSLTAAGACPAPDLWVDPVALANNYLEADCFQPGACDVNEGCVASTGTRVLLRFDAATVNQGTKDMVMSSPDGFPWYVYDACHGHSHFQGFATYRLLSPDGGTVAAARKQGFCLADDHYYYGPQTSRHYTCTYQGLAVGWADNYSGNLPCQYIDVTNVPPGDYILEVEVNPNGALYESDRSNNVGQTPVTLPSFGLPDGSCILLPATDGGTGADAGVVGPLIINPPSASLAPGATQVFTASGGTGAGYYWSLAANNSGGGIFPFDGAYTAGANGNASDTVKLSDSAGNTQTAIVSVGPGVTVTPATASAPPGGSVTFSASGGSGTGYAWSLVADDSGGTIDAQSGIYVAGTTGNVMDVVRVTDSLKNTNDVSVAVTASGSDGGSPSKKTLPAGCRCSYGELSPSVGLLLLLACSSLNRRRRGIPGASARIE